jgi:hypothetical protein
MKQGSNNKRPRRGGAPKGNRGPVRNQTFDSNCSGQRVRGTAQQVMEKYLAMARDAASSGDRILAENFYQHAEHYFRIANANGALSNRIQQQSHGAPVSPTPAHDQTPLDDLFEYEEETALQHQPQHSGGHDRNGGEQRREYQPRPQRHERHEGGGMRDEQPVPPHQLDGEAGSRGDDESDQGDEQGGERMAKPRRARTRRKPAESSDQPAPELTAQIDPADAPQPDISEDAVEAPAKPTRARRTRKPADKAETSATEEGGESPAPRRRRAPARKKASSSDDSGEDGSGGEPREAVA